MTSGPVDVLIVGAGVVGLGHAVHALARGARVAVVERNPRALGASVRNFGHGCFTGQAGDAFRYATAARRHWLRLSKEAGFWLRDAGTVVVARSEDEYAVLEDFRAERGDDAVLLDPAAVRDRVPVAGDIVGGAWLPLDIRVDPRSAASAIAGWLADRGVTFHWSTSAHRVEGDVVRTSRGDLRARRVVVAVGHDVDRLYPAIAEDHGIRRCSLHMLELDNPAGGATVDPAVLTGWSLLRYDGFAVSPALARVRARLTADEPGGVEAGLNLMFTQRPEGAIVFGDTHDYGDAVPPFRAEQRDELLLAQARRLFGAPVGVRARWRGVYASAPSPFLIRSPADLPHVRVVSVTTGIGMTTAFGLAEQVTEEILA
jgi:D-hydroxyproline dehydrogenase subunit beta